MILDDAGRPLPHDHLGEIAVRSRYLSSGYWRRPDLTEKVFGPDPDGGDVQIYRMGDLGRINVLGYLEYAGRRDQQVKIRGYRVEPGEVEAALHSDEDVREAAVVARESRPGERKLVAYVVLKADRSPAVLARLRSALSRQLPDYMVPSFIVAVPALPRTDNGKLDVAGLPVPGRERPVLATPYVPPRTVLEAGIAALWASLLELDTVGVQDHFLDLGGHSLMAMQLVSRILNKYAVDLSPRLLFEASTVEGQCRIIAERLPAASEGLLEQLLNQVEGLSEKQVEGLLHGGPQE
jgi:acyl carrier protein